MTCIHETLLMWSTLHGKTHLPFASPFCNLSWSANPQVLPRLQPKTLLYSYNIFSRCHILPFHSLVPLPSAIFVRTSPKVDLLLSNIHSLRETFSWWDITFSFILLSPALFVPTYVAQDAVWEPSFHGLNIYFTQQFEWPR